MAGTDGQPPYPLIQRLTEKPFGFDFFRAVRLLDSLDPTRPPIGTSHSPARESLRFAQNPSLNFAPSTIEALEFPPGGGVPRMFVRFFGVFGPNAPLPPHFTEYAHERKLNYGDATLTAFCNIFHHRLISFFYRAWAANQKAVDHDRPDDRCFGAYIGSLFGIGAEALRQRDEVQDDAKLYFAGRLACQTRNAEGLAAIVSEYFDIPAEVETFIGRWMDLPDDSRCRLGRSRDTGTLGSTLVVGDRYFERQMNFRLRLGPMSLQDYVRLLPAARPKGGAFRRLKQWILNYCGEHFFWDAQLVLKKTEVPTVTLGQAGLLGWTSWISSGPPARDADDLVLNPAAFP